MSKNNKRSEVRAKTTKVQYFPVRHRQTKLVSSLLYGTYSCHSRLLNLPAFENKN